jgi:hypothetical protein
VVGVGKSLTNCCGFFIYFVNWFLKRLDIKVPGWVEKNITVSGRPPRRLATATYAGLEINPGRSFPAVED